jgi:hypothetical protein
MLPGTPFIAPTSAYEKISGVLTANFVFICISVFFLFFTKKEPNIRLVLLAVLSLTLLGFPSFYMPNLVNDLVIFLVLAVYPSILAITKLKRRPAFERYVKHLKGLTVSLITLYVVYNEIYFSTAPYLPYPLYALAVAMPEFFIIFVDDTTMGMQLIVTYESLLGTFLLLPYVLAGFSLTPIGSVPFAFIPFVPWIAITLSVALASFLLPPTEENQPIFLALHAVLSLFVLLDLTSDLIIFYYSRGSY